MKKRILVILMTALCICSFAACGSENVKKGEDPAVTDEKVAEKTDETELPELTVDTLKEYKTSAASDFEFNEGLEKIDREAFYGCENLIEVKIPKTVTEIGYLAFFGCTSLETVVLNEGLETIGAQAFEYCFNLSELEIPESVTKIGHDAFLECSENFKIIGKSGSYAEQYAAENNIEFVAK